MAAGDKVVIQASYAYQGTYVASRCRNEGRGSFRAVAPLALERLAPGDAPVALRLARRLAPDREKQLPERTEHLEYRWDGERILTPLLSPYGKAMSVSVFEAAMLGDSTIARPHVDVDWPGNPLLVFVKETYGRKTHQERVFCLQTREQAEIRRWVKDDREEKLAGLHGRAADVVVVGDVVHKVCPEPTWELARRHGDRLRPQIGVPEPDADAARFRIDRLDEALALAADLGIEVKPEGDVEVLLPEALRFDSLRSAAETVFGKVAAGLGAMLPALATGEAARAWADLKDAGVAWRGGDHAAVQAGFAALRRLVESDWGKDPGAERHATPSPDVAMPFLLAYERFEAPRLHDAEALSDLAMAP